MQQFTITLLRHGETVAPKNLNGATDVALSRLGKQQMLNAASKLSDIDCTVTSPLQRCFIMAQTIASQWQVPLSIEQQIAEMNFGDWDGHPFDELYQQSPNTNG
ncbi:histidine phosphatase family protein [Psychrobium sp. nBUS_13]|uniref:histidine phosphatase family protein n=1 Tax=Psychrobium sp. nBUS_13 TaxID=3395319 RepID=UPI003EBDADB3